MIDQVSAFGHTIALTHTYIICYVVLVISLASTKFTGSESSQSVNAVVTKSNALTVAIVTVRLSFTRHSAMSATGKCMYLNRLSMFATIFQAVL